MLWRTLKTGVGTSIRKRLHACQLICFLILIGSGQPCPAQSRHTVQPLSLTQLNNLLQAQGNCTLVAFLAAWCHPCIKELPDLVEINKRYQNMGLNVIGISLDLEGPHVIEPLINQKKVDFPVYWVGEEVIDFYQISGIPLLLFIHDGKVVERIKGQRNKKYLIDKVEAILKNCFQRS